MYFTKNMNLKVLKLILRLLQAIRDADPRQLEMILNRPPPFGNHVREQARKMPTFCLKVLREPDLEWNRGRISLHFWCANAGEVNSSKALRRSVSILAGNLVENKLYFKTNIPESEILTASEDMPIKRTFVVTGLVTNSIIFC